MIKTKVKETEVKNQVITKDYAIYNDDCVKTLEGVESNSIGFCIYSPPFFDLYSYSDSENDMSNCSSYDSFLTHYGFLAEQLERVMMPGRIVAVHCMDLPEQKGRTGHIQLSDFPGDIIRLFKSKGFLYHSRHCIWKDPLLAAVRTKALGLAHKQIVKDSAMCRTGIADYILAFRKKGENPVPVEHPEGLTEYVGTRQIPRNLDHFIDHEETKTNKRSHWIWQQYASPVWFDIDQTNVLPFKKGKDKEDTRHICPLQLQVIERCFVLWTREGDVILDPFGGVGSSGYVAVKLKRKAVMMELKPSYFRQMVRNMESLKHKQKSSGFED